MFCHTSSPSPKHYRTSSSEWVLGEESRWRLVGRIKTWPGSKRRGRGHANIPPASKTSVRQQFRFIHYVQIHKRSVSWQTDRENSTLPVTLPHPPCNPPRYPPPRCYMLNNRLFFWRRHRRAVVQRPRLRDREGNCRVPRERGMER